MKTKCYGLPFSLHLQPEEWPFQNFCEVLISDLFHSSWEVRHGAGSGLREVIKLHGQGAGRTVDTPNNQVRVGKLGTKWWMLCPKICKVCSFETFWVWLFHDIEGISVT